MQHWAGPLGGTWSILTVLSDSSIKKEGNRWPWRQCRQGYWCLAIPSTSLFLFWFQQILEQVKKARSGQWITPWLAASWPWWCLPCCVCSSSWGAILPDTKVSQARGQPGGLVSPRRLPLGDFARLSLIGSLVSVATQPLWFLKLGEKKIEILAAAD